VKPNNLILSYLAFQRKAQTSDRFRIPFRKGKQRLVLEYSWYNCTDRRYREIVHCAFPAFTMHLPLLPRARHPHGSRMACIAAEVPLGSYLGAARVHWHQGWRAPYIHTYYLPTMRRQCAMVARAHAALDGGPAPRACAKKAKGASLPTNACSLEEGRACWPIRFVQTKQRGRRLSLADKDFVGRHLGKVGDHGNISG
jgi:hypothetical protein